MIYALLKPFMRNFELLNFYRVTLDVDANAYINCQRGRDNSKRTL